MNKVFNYIIQIKLNVNASAGNRTPVNSLEVRYATTIPLMQMVPTTGFEPVT